MNNEEKMIDYCKNVYVNKPKKRFDEKEPISTNRRLQRERDCGVGVSDSSGFLLFFCSLSSIFN